MSVAPKVKIPAKATMIEVIEDTIDYVRQTATALETSIEVLERSVATNIARTNRLSACTDRVGAAEHAKAERALVEINAQVSEMSERFQRAIPTLAALETGLALLKQKRDWKPTETIVLQAMRDCYYALERRLKEGGVEPQGAFPNAGRALQMRRVAVFEALRDFLYKVPTR